MEGVEPACNGYLDCPRAIYRQGRILLDAAIGLKGTLGDKC